MESRFVLLSLPNFHTAPAFPHATGAVVQTALFGNDWKILQTSSLICIYLEWSRSLLDVDPVARILFKLSRDSFRSLWWFLDTLIIKRTITISLLMQVTNTIKYVCALSCFVYTETTCPGRSFTSQSESEFVHGKGTHLFLTKGFPTNNSIQSLFFFFLNTEIIINYIQFNRYSNTFIPCSTSSITNE